MKISFQSLNERACYKSEGPALLGQFPDAGTVRCLYEDTERGRGELLKHGERQTTRIKPLSGKTAGTL